MLRYKLRTLLILLSVGPPIIAVAWFGRQWLGFAVGLSAFSTLFVLWYWMLCKSQSNPKMRGSPNYDPPSAIPPPGI